MNRESEPARGYYSGTDSHGTEFRLPRHVDPELDGTRLAECHPRRYRVDHSDNSVPSEEFDRLIEATVPEEVLRRVDEVIAESRKLADAGTADSPPLDAYAWRRGIVLSWLHSRDLEVLLDALGHHRDVAGIHDMEEFALGKRLKERLSSADDWYRNWVLSLDDEERVNVGFFNPHLCASMYKWGDARSGTQNAMDAHRLAAHHVGTPEEPLDWIERAANFVVHHIPREHMGIRHEPRGDWSTLEERLATDTAIKDAEIGKQIARDVARLAEMLEREGKIVPWQLLSVPQGPPEPSQIEHAFVVLSARAKGATSTAAAHAASAEPSTSDLEGADDHVERCLRTWARIDEAIEAAERSGRTDRSEAFRRWRDELGNP